MGLSLGSKIVSPSNEYNYKENCLNELKQIENARNQALQAASESNNNANAVASDKIITVNAMENAQTYMIACNSYSETSKTYMEQAKTWAETIDPEVIKNGVISTIYPIGSIYITLNDTNPSETLGIGTWEKVSSGRVLEGSDSSHNAGTTIDAGLPNITGTVGQGYQTNGINGGWHNYGNTGKGTGALYLTGTSNGSSCTWQNYGDAGLIAIDASRSSTIYGKSTTVQPNAYFVNIWKRTA